MSTGSRAWLFSLTLLYAIAISCSMAAMEALSGVLAVWAIFSLVRNIKTGMRIDAETALILAFIAAILLSLFLGSVRPVIWERAFGLTKNLIIFLLLRQLWRQFSIKEKMQLGWVALGSAAVVGLLALSQHFTCQDYVRERVILGSISGGESDCRAIGLFSSSMTYGHSVLLPAIFATGMIFLGGRPKWWQAAIAFFTAAGLFSSYQRGPWVGFIFGLVFLAAFAAPRLRWVFVGSAATLLSGLLLFSDHLRSRLLSVLSLQSVSNLERLWLWRANLEMFKDHPVLGVGYSHNDKLLSEYYSKLGIQNGFISHAHNNVVDFLSGTGILGAGLFLGLLGVFMYRTARITQWPRAWRLSFLAMQVAFFMAGLTECNFKDGEVTHQFVFWMALALSASA